MDVGQELNEWCWESASNKFQEQGRVFEGRVVHLSILNSLMSQFCAGRA